MPRLFQARAMIFGVALVFLVHAHVALDRWYRAFGDGPLDFDPNYVLYDPHILLLASVLLLIGRWWSETIALVIITRLVYFLGYSSILSLSYASDESSLGLAMPRWLVMKYLYQPQELLHLALGLVILVYAGSRLLGNRRFIDGLSRLVTSQV